MTREVAETRAESADEAPPPHDTHGDAPEARAVLALLATVVFFAVVNSTMINVALPIIGQDFRVTEGTYGWLVTGYSLAFGIFNAIDGRLAEIVGVRRLYLSGMVLLGLTALAIAAAPAIEWAIALRVMQGAGGAALPVLGATIVAGTVAPERRGAAMGVILSTVGVAASIGPFLGGLILQWFGWRAIFLVVGPVLLLVPVAWRVLPRSLDARSGQGFDVVGAGLLGGAVACVMYGATLLRHGPPGMTVAGLLGGGLALGAAFLWWVHRHPEPFASPALLRHGAYLSVCAQAFVGNGARFGAIVLVPIVLKQAHHLEPVWIGAVLFPGALGIALMSSRSGVLADRFGPRLPVGIGTTILLIGNLATAAFAATSPLGLALAMGLTGLGYAFIQTPLLSTASQLAPPNQTSSALGLFMMILFVGGATGVALVTTVIELQPPSPASWLGWGTPSPAQRYSNAALALTVLGMLGVLLFSRLPGRLGHAASNKQNQSPS